MEMNVNMIEPIDNTALFKIGYGLYVITTNDGKKDNGLIVNTVTQVAEKPLKIAVSINKANYSFTTIKETGKMNVCCLTESAPFSLFKNFGFQSGKDADKFSGVDAWRTKNGLMCLRDNINSVISLSVDDFSDMGSHGLFICSVSEAHVISDEPSMTYAYYHANVKPKPEAKKKGFVCKICGYVYEGETLPEDFVCPLCKHGASDFEPVK